VTDAISILDDEPCMAVKACRMLQQLGPIVSKSGLDAKGVNIINTVNIVNTVNIPWTRIITGTA